jgi:ribose transport system permease protein
MATPQTTNEGAAASSAAPAPAARREASWASKLIGVQGPLIGLVALCVIFSLTTGAFLSFRNLLNVLDQVTVLGILSIGMTLVIIIGGIDLSVGSVLAFSMMVLGWLSHDWKLPLAVAILIALLIIGVLHNGLNLTGVSPFIQQVVIGVVIALAVSSDTLRRRGS